MEDLKIDKSRIFLAYNFYINKTEDKYLEIITKEKLALDDINYISYLLKKDIHIQEINPDKVDQYFKKILFKDKSKSSMIAEGLHGTQTIGTHEKIQVNFNDEPIIKLVNSILEEAANANASDIHIEAQDDKMRTRYRIDGVLATVLSSPLIYLPAVSARIKYLARLDITQKLAPQDGKAQVEINNNFLDLRVSTIPTRYGESIVIRILNRDESFIDLARIGFDKKTEESMRELLQLKNGLILVTGPTGSGKSTTLYAMLKILNDEKSNILTVEDPIEYEIGGINQVEINTMQGLSFPKMLRHFLRHDPDIIMIGEIRDEETARIAIQASLTGHLVLSTLHTNDTVSAVTRLIDLGIEPYLIGSSLHAILAQRLVRVLCPKCKQPLKTSSIGKDIQILNKKYNFKPKQLKYHNPKGCKNCFNSGYKGRTAVFEYLQIDKNIRDLITKNNPEENISKHLKSKNFISIETSGLQKMAEGISSAKEIEKIFLVE